MRHRHTRVRSRSTRRWNSGPRSDGASSLPAFRLPPQAYLGAAVSDGAGCCAPSRPPGRCPMSPAPSRCGADPSQDSPMPSPIPAVPAPPRSDAVTAGTGGHRAPRPPGSGAASATPWSARPRSTSGSAAGGCRSIRCTTKCVAALPGSRVSGGGRPSGVVPHRRAAQSETRRCPVASRRRPAPLPPRRQPSPPAPGPVVVPGPPTEHSTTPPSSPGRPPFQLLPRGFILQGKMECHDTPGDAVRARLGRFYGEVTTSRGFILQGNRVPTIHHGMPSEQGWGGSTAK